jgi:hypothetical protein
VLAGFTLFGGALVDRAIFFGPVTPGSFEGIFDKGTLEDGTGIPLLVTGARIGRPDCVEWLSAETLRAPPSSWSEEDFLFNVGARPNILSGEDTTRGIGSRDMKENPTINSNSAIYATLIM